MMFLNYTPHTLNVVDNNGNAVNLPSVGVARVATTDTVRNFGGFTLTTSTFGDVVGLPAPVDGVVYVVSRLVLTALNGSRSDVVAPGVLLRDDNGNVVGCKGFGR